MTKLIWHTLPVTYKDAGESIRRFSELGAFFADAGDFLISNTKPCDELSMYYRSAGVWPNHINWIKQENLEQISLQHIDNIDAFAWSEGQHNLITQFRQQERREIGVSHSNHDSFARKSDFKAIVADLGFSTPAGSSASSNQMWLYISALKYLWLNKSEILIKANTGVSGYNTERHNLKSLQKKLREERSVFPQSKLILNDKTFFIEEWVADSLCHPSVQLLLLPGEKPEILSNHNQLFFPNQRTYRGCQSVDYLDDELLEQLTIEAQMIGDAYAALNYVGHLGLNALVSKTRGLLWLEANPRRVMSSYAFRISSLLQQKSPYIMYNLSRPRWQGQQESEIFLSLQKLLFSSKKQYGVIPLQINPSAPAVLCFITAQNKAHIEEIFYDLQTI